MLTFWLCFEIESHVVTRLIPNSNWVSFQFLKCWDYGHITILSYVCCFCFVFMMFACWLSVCFGPFCLDGLFFLLMVCKPHVQHLLLITWWFCAFLEFIGCLGFFIKYLFIAKIILTKPQGQFYRLKWEQCRFAFAFKCLV